MIKTLTILAVATLSLMAQPTTTTTTPAPTLVLPCGSNGGASVTSTGTLDAKTTAGASFQVLVNLSCDASRHPQGTLTLSGLNGSPGATMTATGFTRLTSVAGSMPTAYLSGACSLTNGNTTSDDCRYWIMFSQLNARTSEPQQIGIVSFSVVQSSGARIALGSGKVVAPSGRLTVASTSGSN